MKRLAELFKKRSGKPKQLKSQRRQLLMEGLERREVFAAFVVGNLAVIRANEVDNNAPMSVIELSKTTTSQTNDAVQKIDIGSNFRISGSATSTGYLALTNDGSRLTFANPVTTDTANNVNTITTRSVGVLDSAGTFTVGASYTGTSGQQARGATSLDNSAFFIADQTGIYTNGSTAASPTANVRAVKSFGGTVYVSHASSTVGTNIVNTISAPSGGTITSLPGLSNNSAMQDYYLIQSGDNGSTYDVLYTIFATSNTAGTISKFSLVSGNWVANGTATTSFGGFGLAAEDSGAGANLYITSGLGALNANTVQRLIDSAGYNSTLALGAATTLYTAPTGTTVKGIAFTPVSTASEPEVNVQGNSQNIVDGDTTPSATDHTLFPSTVVGNSNTRTYTIQNTGTANLTLSAPTSTNAAFVISGFPAGPITAGNSATFDVVFTPTTAGTVSSTISFANNDSNENPYDFVVEGTGTAAAAPEANLRGNSVTIVDGDTTPSTTDHTQFVDTVVGSTSTRTFTIENTGTADLTLSAPTSSDLQFTISGFPSGPITAGNSATFNVVFSPTVAAAATATISFGNNDSDENPYDFVVGGTGLAAVAEANVRGNGVDIVDGDTTPDSADHTVFAAAAVGGTSSRTFTIQNLGTIDLTLSTFTSSNPRFTIPTPPAGPVAPGGSATFTVVFSPLVASTETATISFANNDSDENPYDFVVSGTGVAIEPLYINEMFFNPPGTDAPNEYVEIRGTANAIIPSGTYLVGIEGDTTGMGDVQTMFDLSGLTIGSNGYLVISQSTNTYAVNSGATSVVATGTGFTGAAGFSADSSGTDIENTTVTFLLIRTSTAPTLTDDIDSNNDGVADGSVFSGWTIADSIGIVDNSADGVYSDVVFSTAATFVGSSGKSIIATTGAANYVARIGTSTANSSAAWFGGGVEGTAPNFNLISADAYPAAYGGQALNHIGSLNPTALATPTITITSGSVVYSDTVYVATASVTGFAAPDPTSSLTFTFYSDAGGTNVISAPENVGTYYVRASTTANAGNNAAQSVIAPFQITPFGLTATASASNKAYDGNTSAVVTINLAGVFSGDTVTGSATGTFDNKNVGTGKTVTVGSVTLAGTDAGNYTVGSAGNTTADITAKALTITAPSVASKVYDGLAAAGAVTVGTLSGFVGSETVTATAVASAYSSANVGSYSTTVSYTLANGTNGGLASNYSLANGSATGQVTPAPLTVTAEAKSKTVGQVDPPLTFTTSALASGDTAATALTGSLARAAGESVGTYAINQGTLAAVNGNYSISYVAANFTINPAAAAPTLTSVVVNGADTFLNQAQRSMVTSVVVTFSAPVILTAGAFSITNIGLFTASSINLAQSQILVTPNATNDVYTLRFAAGTSVNTRLGTGVLGNSLADGSYRLTVDSTKVSNAGGNLTGNNVFGAAAADNFFRMYGDANGDGTVNAIDRSALQAALSASNAALDFDGNGSTSAGVDTTNYFSNNYKRRRLF